MSRERANRRVALAAIGVIGGMLGLTAASVPLYSLFCQVTGYGGTTQRADAAGDSVDIPIRVRFNANVAGDMPWRFAPEQRLLTVNLGDSHLAQYRAMNPTDHAIVGTATYNITPHTAGAYFNKIQCFCFNEQTLEPGQAVDMPVTFFVDPAIKDDPDTAGLEEITLSYTFFVDEQATRELAGQAHAAAQEPSGPPVQRGG
ncbi:cytochrome c oxidase assembly protein [Marinivivus vitaminiproducens]|uniref:cytochrome c oxidase assembly protein n=1 Tax=Marinivivus vitaminiproducens TaxID=3035935 RepID=UPI0027A49CF5|nr:cytochrome c oxidase assembly protein [Geminicoccaceae bacterium SCSIO 64248]